MARVIVHQPAIDRCFSKRSIPRYAAHGRRTVTVFAVEEGIVALPERRQRTLVITTRREARLKRRQLSGKNRD